MKKKVKKVSVSKKLRSQKKSPKKNICDDKIEKSQKSQKKKK